VRGGDYWPSRWRSERATVYFFRLAHKADVGAPRASDQAILDRVDDITALMLDAPTEHAMDIDDRPWLRRQVWWRAQAYALRNDKPAWCSFNIP
jgi:hypothetical protein